MITFKKHSGIYTLSARQELPIALNEAWSFFSDPRNLENITPPQLAFKITSLSEQQMYSGQIITYRVGILPGVVSSWVTEIKAVEFQRFFVDEQRFGPYAMWHHEHSFERLKNGNTAMCDRVSYKIPLGSLGQLAHVLFVKKQLAHIFEYRYHALEKLFGAP